LALASGARAIVTGDADMLVLDPWRDIRIVKLTEVEMVILPTIATG
jgi:predicted nucleic acid-binding protein